MRDSAESVVGGIATGWKRVRKGEMKCTAKARRKTRTLVKDEIVDESRSERELFGHITTGGEPPVN